MKKAKKRSKMKPPKRTRYKIKPIYLPNGDIHDADELMIKYDFDNDPYFKAQREKIKAFFQNNPSLAAQLGIKFF
jgi:hypothetical protein